MKNKTEMKENKKKMNDMRSDQKELVL